MPISSAEYDALSKAFRIVSHEKLIDVLESITGHCEKSAERAACWLFVRDDRYWAGERNKTAECANCGEEFSLRKNKEDASEPDLDGRYWDDHDEEADGLIDTEQMREEHPDRFYHPCCGGFENAEGCTVNKHVGIRHECLLSTTQSSEIPNQDSEASTQDSEPSSQDTEASTPNSQLSTQKPTMKRARYAEYAEYAECSTCGEEFDMNNNNKRACVYHLEESQPNYNSDWWADHDEDCHGDVDSAEMREQCPEGFTYPCCGQVGTDEGCIKKLHVEKPGKRVRYY
ncbi:MAG: hypothetical protein M1835_006115 [Candelina submexicana]|nr:MAG: hypothetical protein M1835_006115 [Candelina submexicana]